MLDLETGSLSGLFARPAIHQTLHPLGIRGACIPWPGTALGVANNAKNTIMIKCFHDDPTMEESSALIFHSSNTKYERF